MSNVKTLFIVDSAVKDTEEVIKNLPKGSEVIVLNEKADGVQQIVEITSNYENLENIQIISHGDAGELSLGSSVINNENIEFYKDSLSKIGASLSPTGDLLFYGCKVAEGSEGEAFVNKISQYSGAGVSASSNITGFAALGGDFILEYSSGMVETVPISLYGLNSVLWSSGLTDANVKAKVQAAESAGASFTFLEMRDILDTAKIGGINTNEWNDLNTIYDQVLSAGSFENNFVKYASYSVIKGNTKFNSKFYGGVTKKADVKTVGNMTDGFSETNANYLIQEWFYGGDTPMPLAGGDSANPDSASGVYDSGTFTSSATLYEGDKRTSNDSTDANRTITADDVNQGAVGSCYYVAAIGAMAQVGNGSLISNCFVDTGDPDVWGIRYIMPGGEEVYVTVNREIATKTSWGSANYDFPHLIFSGNIDSALDGEMWVALMEKSWAQFNQYLGRADGISSYGAIEGGWADPIKYLTGLEFQYYSAHPDWYKYYGFNKIATDNTGKQILIDGLANDGIGWIASWTPTYTDDSGNYSLSSGKKNLIAQHAHMVLKYDATKGTAGEFLIRNPWGGDEHNWGGGYQPEWWMTYDEMIGANLQTIVAISESATNLLSNNTPPTPKTFTYSISSNSSNPQASQAVDEGSDITFTIKRDDTGEESVVYVSTIAGSATGDDYKAVSKEEIKFLSHEQYKTYTVKTYEDVATEGSNGFDNFYLGLYKTLTQSEDSPTVKEKAYIEDVVPPNYSYAIVSNTSDASDSNFRAEGGKVKFTITRTLEEGNTNVETTIYISTVLKSASVAGPDGKTITGASANDFGALNNQAVTFKAIETTKKIYVDVQSDSTQEGYEYFDVSVYKDAANNTTGAANGTTAVTATGYIKDEWAPNYNYSITSNAGDENSAVNEGQKVTFTVTRSGAGTESTVYLSTLDKTAMAGDDYIGFEGKALTFTKNQKTLNVEVETRLDTWVEPAQYFDLGLYTNINDQTVLSTGTAYIKDTYVAPDYYTVTNTSLQTGDPDGIALTQTLSSTGAQNLELADGAAFSNGGVATLTGGKIVSITSAGNDTAITFTITGKDQEGDELISAESSGVIAADTSLTLVGGSAAISFNNAHKVTITSAGDDTAVTFKVEGTDASGDYLMKNILGSNGGVVTTDVYFKTVTAITPASQTLGTVKAGIAANTVTEVIAGTDSGVATSTKIFNSVSQIQASGDTAGAVTAGTIDGTNEGSDITFTITRTVADPTNSLAANIFVDTSDATATETDYDQKDKFKISFAEYETQKSFTISTDSDSISDDDEFLWANFYMNETTETSFVNSKAYLNDVDVPTNHTYTITHNSATGSAITEGGNITFTITRATTGGAEASTIYLSTLNNTTDDEDLVGIDKLQIDFANKEEIKTVTVTTKTDSIGDEGEEDFYLLLYKSLGDAETGDNYQHSQAYIGNAAAADYSYTVKAENGNWSTPMEESGVITFTVTRALQTGSAAPSTVYVSTTAGNADADDYVMIDKVPLSFATQETSKTVKVTTVTDSETEGKEYFWLDVFKTYDDAAAGNWYAYDTGYITDPTGGGSVEYTYTITSSHGSSGAGVTEGGEVTFTITRARQDGNAISDSDSATTVYASTSHGTADSGDYTSLNLFAVDFKASETTKTVNVQTLADSETDDDENFYIDLYKSAADQESGDYAAWGVGYIANDSSSSDAATTYDYAVTSSHGTDSGAATEGKDIVFTITRSRVDTNAITSSDAKTTVYVSTSDGSTYSDDYVGVDKLAVEFKNDETVKTVTIGTILDSETEGTSASDAEYFWLDLFKTLADVDTYNYHSYGTGYIIDDSSAADALANYTYTVSSSHGTSGNGVTEGGEVTFTITRAREDGATIGNSDIATTVYVSTSEGTAYEDDYVGINAVAIDFKKAETTQEITVKTNIDEYTDDDEYFWLDLFKTKADIENYNYEAWAEGYIANDANSANAVTNYFYTVTSSHNQSGSGVLEGGDITFTVTRQKESSSDLTGNIATTIYYSTSAGTATGDDFEVITNQALEFKADETSKTITVKTKADDETDDDEYFWFDIYETLTDAENYNYYAWDEGYIANDAASATAATTYKYAISSVNDTGNSGTAATEGGIVTFTVTRSRVDNAAIDENNDVVSQVYVSTETGTADEDDYVGISQQLIEFKKGQTTAEVQVQTLGDALSESTEYLSLELFKTLADYDEGNFHSYGNAHIDNDSTVADAINNFDYSVSSSHDYGNAASEGTDIVFTITRTKNGGNDVATTVYVTTTHSMTDDSDISMLNAQAVEFKADESVKTITVNTYTDSDTEGEEYFWLDLFKTKAAAEDYDYHAWAAGYLTDNSDAAGAVNQYSYTVTGSADASMKAVDEGTDITFTITRTNDTGGANVASTVYVSTSDSLASSGEDYKAVDLTAVDFKAGDTTKTITVKTYADSDTEGEEDFWLDLYKTKADADDYNYHDYASAYIKDPTGGGGSDATYSYAISITSGAKTAEGGNVTASITRTVDTGSAGNSTIYFNTTAGSADETDYVSQKATAVNFDAGNAAQTVTVVTLNDGDASEGDEYFWIDLFNTEADAEEGWDYFDYATATIDDGAALAAAGISYTITSNSQSDTSDKADEGTDITFTISDGGASAASTVYVSTVAGTASSDDYVTINKQQVDFTASEDTKTVTVTTYTDAISDDGEFFYLELYKTDQDADSGTEAVDSKAFIENVASVVDTSSTFSVTTSSTASNPTIEGNDVVFTVTRQGDGSANELPATTIYYSTTAYDAGTNDYTAATAQALSFNQGETSKTVSIATTSDGDDSEGLEDFWLDLFQTKAAAEAQEWWVYELGYIQDAANAAANDFSFSIAPKNDTYWGYEGSDATFTITKTGTGSSSETVYVSTPIYTADEYSYGVESSDITPLDHLAVTFAADEWSKDISITTVDDGADSSENLYVYLSKTSDSSTKDWDDYTGGYANIWLYDAPSNNSGANAGNSGSPTVTITSAPKSSFPGHKAGVFFNDYAFAAKTASGNVVAWGNAAKGGDTSPISDVLTGVSNIYSNSDAFAAVLSDGSVVTWGDPEAGGTNWDLDGLSESSTMTAGGNLTLGGAAATGGSATFSQAQKITITSVGDDSTRTFTVTGKDTSGSTLVEQISGVNAGTARGSSLFKIVESIAVDSATAAAVSAGSVSSSTFAIASSLNGTVDVSKIASTPNAFAALKTDGSVVAWGSQGTGGDTSGLMDEDLDGSVSPVREIFSNNNSFAALRADGSVVTWGISAFGGSSSSVENKIKTTTHADFQQVTSIVATGSAYAAIRADGSLVTWGNSLEGGDSSSVSSEIDGDTDVHDVVQVYATTSAFAALRKDGSVITWGDANNGGTSSDVASSINGGTDVTAIYSTNSAFAALRSDGSVITWGDGNYGGTSTSVASDLDGTVNVSKIFATTSAFAALREDGKVVTWGYNSYGGDSSGVSALIDGTLDSDCISASQTLSDLNLTLNGDLISSGSATFTNAQRVSITSTGDDSGRTFTVTGTDKDGGALTATITGANAGTASSTEFFKTVTAISVDAAPAGAITAGVVDKTVTTIVATDKAFTALRADGSVITWGDASGGGDSSAVSNNLVLSDSNTVKVSQLYSSSAAFSAIKDDGSVVTWGDNDRGGSSTSVDFSNVTVKGMSGASSGIEATLKTFSQNSSGNDVPLANKAISFTNSSGVSAGALTCDASGALDVSSLDEGNYSAGYTLDKSVAADYAITEQSLTMSDIQLMLNILVGKVTATSDQIIAANVYEDTNVDMQDVQLALNTLVGKVDASVVLRDSTAATTTYNANTTAVTNASNQFAVQAGTDLPLDAYFLGDLDGGYANYV